MAQTKKRQRGNVGQEIFEQVERLVSEQKIPRLTAFKQLSAKSGRRVGTVAANYYRVARKKGAKLRRRKPAAAPGRARAARRRVGRPRANSTGTATRILRDLGKVLREQEAELGRLRRENARLAEIRKLVSA